MVSPRQRVSVTVEVSQALYESAPQTAQAVLERVPLHLASLGIGTDANQPVVLHVVYQEQKVTETFIDKRKPRNSRERHLTVSVLKVNLTLSWRNRQGDLLQTYWPGRSFRSEDLGLPDVHTAREHRSRMLQSLPVAWFMPQDPNLPVLPYRSPSSRRLQTLPRRRRAEQSGLAQQSRLAEHNGRGKSVPPARPARLAWTSRVPLPGCQARGGSCARCRSTPLRWEAVAESAGIPCALTP
jgi:hypothetical protein